MPFTIRLSCQLSIPYPVYTLEIGRLIRTVSNAERLVESLPA